MSRSLLTTSLALGTLVLASSDASAGLVRFNATINAAGTTGAALVEAFELAW
jgi:hypothetical protein